MRSPTVIRSAVSAVVLLGFLSLAAGCYGPFNLTRIVYKWNGGLKGNNATETKWMIEGVFLIFIGLPVYGIALFADAVVFNSIQFWTGENPIKVTDSEDGTTKVVQIRETTATLSFSPDRHLVHVAYAREGTVFQRVEVIRQDSAFRILDDSGKELYTAVLNDAGRLLVADKECEALGSFAPEQIEGAAAAMASASRTFVLAAQ